MEHHDLVPWGCNEPEAIFQSELKELEALLELSEDAEIELLLGWTGDEEGIHDSLYDRINVLHGQLPETDGWRSGSGISDSGLLDCILLAAEQMRGYPMLGHKMQRTIEDRKLGRMHYELSAAGVSELMADAGIGLLNGFGVSDEELLELLDDGAAVICCVSSLMMKYLEAAGLLCAEADRFILVYGVETKNGIPYTIYYADPVEESGMKVSYGSKKEILQMPYSDFSRGWSVSDRRTLILQEGIEL